MQIGIRALLFYGDREGGQNPWKSFTGERAHGHARKNSGSNGGLTPAEKGGILHG